MQDTVTVDVLFYQRHPERGWHFKPEAPGCTPDTVNGGMQFIRQLYEKLESKEKSVSRDLTCLECPLLLKLSVNGTMPALLPVLHPLHLSGS